MGLGRCAGRGFDTPAQKTGNGFFPALCSDFFIPDAETQGRFQIR
jgi:hypothetical protein